jgi:hypothetical protein
MAKGRKGRNIEFFQFLAEILDLEDYNDFARTIGKTVSNVHAYYNGKKTPGKRVLLSALRHAFEWEVRPIIEVKPIEEAKSLTTEPGYIASMTPLGV